MSGAGRGGSLESQDSVASGSSDDVAGAAVALMEDADLPTSIHVTNMELDLFENEQLKACFEAAFMAHDAAAWFQYFPSFRRARVNYSTPKAAARARVHLHETTVCGSTVKCYFIQPSASRDESDDGTLHPPLPEKQYLISPPASPPVGWEPVREAEPLVNYDLLTAVTQMAPGEAHELHPGRDRQPSIVVQVAEDTDSERSSAGTMRIPQTRCPSR